MKSLHSAVASSLIFFTSIIVASQAMAYPRHDPNVFDSGNLWSITFHDDNSTAHNQWATQRICFSPYAAPGANQTHIRGTWYSTTYPRWHGHYRQEGDSVKMVGNFWQGKGNDGITFDIVTSLIHTGLGQRHRTIGAGHWHEWGDDGRFGPVYGFGNALLQRVGRCRTIGPKQLGAKGQTLELKALDASDAAEFDVPPRRLKDGSEARYPMQEGQEELKEANHLEELF